MQQPLLEQIPDEDLFYPFDAMTLSRGRGYAHDGHVLDVSVDDSGCTVTGVVRGGAGRQYTTTVYLHEEGWPDDAEPYCTCTCPVRLDCKHAAALLIVAREQGGRAVTGPGQPGVQQATPAWEWALAEVLKPADAEAATTPLALQLEVETTRPRSPAYSSFRTPLAPQRQVRLRPVVPGAKGAWIRTGVSWQLLRFGQGSYLTEHRAALRELLLVYELSGRAPYGTYSDAVYLDSFGPMLWRALGQVVEAGVQLVPTKHVGGPVVLSADPATVSLDVTGDDRGATVRPRVTCGERPVDMAAVDLLGAPPHGLVWHTGGGLVLAPFEAPVQQWLVPLLQGEDGLAVPGPDLHRFLADYYPRLRRAVPVTSSDGSVELPAIAPPRLGLTLSYHDGHRIALEWAFEYPVGETVHTYPLASTGDQRRDAAAEHRLVQDLPLPHVRLPHLWNGSGATRRPSSPVILSGMDAVAFVDEMLPALREHPGVVVHEKGERPDFREAETAPEVRIGTADTDDPDWFDLHIVVFVDGEEVPFDALFTALARGESHLLLPSGLWFNLDRPELEELRRLIEEARELLDADDGPVRLSRYQAGFWEELCALGVVEQQSERWSRQVGGLVDLDEVTPPELPSTLRATLRPYQVDGFRWMALLWESQLGGVLADDMGLGKTVQTLALLCHAKETGRLDAPVLVVAPTSVVRNWVNEAAQFAPDLSVVAVTETTARCGKALAEQLRGADVVVTSYALFRIDEAAYGGVRWSGLVLDEAQLVKNHRGKTYQCARRLAAPFKLAITGTPMENNLMELWALLSIVAPGLFPSPEKFSDFYRKPIERGSDKDLLQTLRRRVRPLMRRRTKEQVAADLPAKQEQVLEVDLTGRHRRIYDTHLQRERQKILGLLDDLDKHRFTVLKSLTLLRQLSLDPSLVDEEHLGVRSSKLDVLVEHLTELVAEGHRALVFSQFTGFLRKVRERLGGEGLPYCYLDGRTHDRQKVIDAFKAGEAPVFLISLKAGGFGLNLTEADYCFILDPWWNPATEAQAVDRTHRIGQDKQVLVYRLVSSNTIEQKVMALKQHKAELFNSVMDDDGTLSGPLSAEDVRGLLEH